jgi:hypothetical protein
MGMVIVTGDPRSGTSLTMQMLDMLGIEATGEKFFEPKKETSDELTKSRMERQKKLNPGGFYEIQGVVMRGFLPDDDFSLFENKSVKVIAPSSLPPRTPQEHVDKYVFCVRNPKSVAMSQLGLNETIMTEQKLLGSPDRYISEIGDMVAYLKDNMDDRWLFIDYDDTIENPMATAQAICDHVGGDQSKVKDAAAIVKQKLKRSDKEFAKWPSEQSGMLVEDIYKALSNHDLMDTVAADRQSYYASQRLENVTWWSPEYGRHINPSLARSIEKKPRLRKNLKKDIAKRTELGHYPEVVEAEETYTIKRPDDLGDLVRNKVVYEGEEMTWEAAIKKHQVKRFRS